MLVEKASGEPRWHGLGLAEIHHVQTARRDYRWHAGFRRRRQTLRSRRKDAANEFIGPLCGGYVQHAGHKAAGDQRFHGFAALAGTVENQHFFSRCLHQPSRLVHAVRRIPEHARHHHRSIVLFPVISRRLHHSANGASRVSKNHAGNTVHPCHIHDCRNHYNIRGTDVRSDVSAGEC